MRRPVLVGALGILAACGGSSEAGPTPPPPTPVPASIAIDAGDGQVGVPGAAVVTAPRVVVRDGSGRAMAGVTVSFAADSGGGRVGNASVATGSDGTASTTWTLGAAEGVNTLVASVGALTPVRFHATGRLVVLTLIDTASVPVSGGTLEYRKTGDSLSGVRLTVPSAAYAGPTRFALTVDRAMAVTVPAGMRQVGPVFVVASDGGFADEPMVLRLPARATASEAVGTFFYDPATGTFEGMPTVARDDSTVTVVSKHFREAMLWHRATGALASPRQASSTTAPLPFGKALIVNLAAPRAAITAPITTGFLPGRDDWEFPNNGSYQDPRGICAGMSITAMYYFYKMRGGATPAGPALFHSRDTWLPEEWDNPQGIAFASLVQVLQDWSAAGATLARLVNYAAASQVPFDQLTFESLALTMSVTHQPQLVGMWAPPPLTGGHAVVGYAINGGAVSFADPNLPGASRTMTYASGAFAPVQLGVTASGGQVSMTQVMFFGSSALVNAANVAQYFTNFQNGTATTVAFPPLVREYYDRLTSAWVPLPGSGITTSHRVLAVRTRCTRGCTRTRPTPPPRITTGIKDSLNRTLAFDGADTDTAAVFVFGRSAYPDSFRVAWDSFHDGVDTYLGNTIVTIHTVPFFIKPGPANGSTTQDMDFTASSASFNVSTATYVWDFGDGTPRVSKVADSTVTHRWTKVGTYPLKAELRDNQNRLLASDQTTVTIGGKFAITPKPDTTAVLTDLALTASSAGYQVANLRYVWDFGDGTPTVVKQADSVVTHQWAATGTYNVHVELRDAQQNVLAMDNASVLVLPLYGWMLQAATIQLAQLQPAGGLGPVRSDTAVFRLAQGWLNDLTSPNITTGILAAGNFQQGAACYGGVVLSMYPNAVWVPPSKMQLTDERALVAICGDPDYTGSFAMGPLGNGTLVGSAQSLNPPDVLQFEGGSINAAMSGKTLTGTFTALIRYSNGTGKLIVSFTARQAFP